MTLVGASASAVSFGFAEVLSQNYDVDASSDWQPISEYDYTNDKVKPTISKIWNTTYSCIANLNIMLGNLEKANKAMFQDNEYSLCFGEGLGLRGFLHFELMRLFASSPAMNGNDKGVPYATEYGKNIPVQKSVNETMDFIIADLLKASEYLEHDSLYASKSPYTHTQRRYYYNYYANELVLSRAYLWKGDKENALREFGDFLFSVINAGRLYHLNPDTALELSNRKFISRFNYIEEHSIKMGKPLKDMTLGEMDQLWNEAKSKEKEEEIRNQ